MKKTAFLHCAAIVLLSAGNALAATPSVMGHGTPHKVISNTPGLVTLYDQTSDELSGALNSQNYGSPNTLYDDQAADGDRTGTGTRVPSRRRCTAQTVGQATEADEQRAGQVVAERRGAGALVLDDRRDL